MKGNSKTAIPQIPQAPPASAARRLYRYGLKRPVALLASSRTADVACTNNEKGTRLVATYSECTINTIGRRPLPKYSPVSGLTKCKQSVRCPCTPLVQNLPSWSVLTGHFLAFAMAQVSPDSSLLRASGSFCGQNNHPPYRSRPARRSEDASTYADGYDSGNPPQKLAFQ